MNHILLLLLLFLDSKNLVLVTIKNKFKIIVIPHLLFGGGEYFKWQLREQENDRAEKIRWGHVGQLKKVGSLYKRIGG